MKPKILLIALLFSASSVIWAVETSKIRSDTSVAVHSSFSSSKLTEVNEWGLNATELRRYELLMQGVRKHLSTESISPVEVLGIHARNDAERRKYARMWAKLMIEDAARVLAFQHAYDEEIAKLLANQPIIDEAVISSREKERFALQPSDRIVFVSALDCSVCDITFARVVDRLDEVAAVDVFFTGLEESDQLKGIAWLRAFGIDSRFYREKRVTLNFEWPTHLSSPVDLKAPALFVLRGDNTQRIPSYVFP